MKLLIIILGYFINILPRFLVACYHFWGIFELTKEKAPLCTHSQHWPLAFLTYSMLPTNPWQSLWRRTFHVLEYVGDLIMCWQKNYQMKKQQTTRTYKRCYDHQEINLGQKIHKSLTRIKPVE